MPFVAYDKNFKPAPAAEFHLSITKALADQLHEALAARTPAPLDEENIDSLLNRPGVYVLTQDTQRVYVGKASKSLRARLRQHLRKLSGRLGTAGAISFICLYVDEDLEASAPEKLLIKMYRSEGEVPWNYNGFGNKDPGKRRDTSLVKENHFDAQFPADLDYRVALDSQFSTTTDVLSCLRALKESLPYLLRYDRDRKNELQNTVVEIPKGALPLRDWLRLVVNALAPDWQATALPGYVILYREPNDPSRHPSARAIWRKNQQGVTVEVSGPSQKAPPGEIDDDVTED